MATSCAGGLRPTLVDPDQAAPLDVASGLAPAPPEVAPLAPSQANVAPAPALEDALYVWAEAIELAYSGGCELGVTPGVLCHVFTDDPNTVFLGPNGQVVYHVVTVSQITSDDGTGGLTFDGYRVTAVKLAGS